MFIKLKSTRSKDKSRYSNRKTIHLEKSEDKIVWISPPEPHK